MKKFLVVLIILLSVTAVFAAGQWSPNHYGYKPQLTTQGTTDKANFDTAMDLIDSVVGGIVNGGYTQILYLKELVIRGPEVDCRAFGVTRDKTTIDAALAYIGSKNKALVFYPDLTDTTTSWATGITTIPSNVNVKVSKGALLNLSTNTLTINGIFEAGLYQTFSYTGAGKVVFGPGSVTQVYSEWWGAKADGTTDSGPAIGAALTAFPVLQLAHGTYRWNTGSTLYLDSTVQNLVYHIRGDGRGTIIDFNGWGAASAIKVNETSGGVIGFSLPYWPRIVVQDITFDGTNSSGVRGFYFNSAAGAFERIRFIKMGYGVSTTGYCDGMSFRKITWNSPYDANSWLYKPGGNGDGFVAEQIEADQDSNVIDLYKCLGGSIRNCIGGRYKVRACQNITVENLHCENTVSTALTWIDSQGIIKNSYFQDDYGYPIVIDETALNGQGNQVSIEGNVFSIVINDASKVHNDDIRLGSSVNFGVQNKITLKNNYRTSIQSSPGPPVAAIWEFQKQGIVVSSNLAALNTALAAVPHLHSGNVEIGYNGSTWLITPIGGSARELPLLPATTFAVNPSTNRVGDMPATTYNYTAAAYTDAGHSAAIADVPLTTTATNSVGIIVANTGAPYTWLRIWRKTGAGAYDRYVDVPMPVYRTALVDHGSTSVSGFPWITTGVPTPPITNTSMAGTILSSGGTTVWGTFTCANNKDTVVTNSLVTANSLIYIMPTNAAAGALQAGTTALYVSAKVAGTSFTVTTADAGAAAGTETFNYLMIQ